MGLLKFYFFEKIKSRYYTYTFWKRLRNVSNFRYVNFNTGCVIHRRIMSKVHPITKFLIDKWDTKIIAISEVVKKVLIEENKFKEEKIKVIYNAIPNQRFKINYDIVAKLEQQFYKKNKKIVLSIGNLYPTKGFSELIEVTKILKDRIRNLLVLIVGEDKERKKLEKLITQYNLFNFVKLLGFRNDIIELLKICDCFTFLRRAIWECFY